MKTLFIMALVSLSACGFNGTQRLEVTDSHQTISGDVNINLTFIQQLITLCQNSLLPESFGSEELYNQAVAQCVLHSSQSLNLGPACQPGADLSGFTPEQIQTIQASCNLLGGGH